MRQIVLDTETTGLSPNKGDRIVEVGCVELIGRKHTGRHFHYYVNPERDIPAEVVAVHGIDNEKVKDSPKFRDIAEEFWQFVAGAELVIHNAAFDMGFLQMEFDRLATEGRSFGRLAEHCSVLDTLMLAREKHPGAKASLDALCKRYGIDNSHRTLHGALLDSEILADVYLMMTGGQTALILDEEPAESEQEEVSFDASAILASGERLTVVRPTEMELDAHQQMLAMIEKASGAAPLWHGRSK
nr:DNA polymerase III subunit epsilon [Saccharospirillum mangrovi]